MSYKSDQMYVGTAQRTQIKSNEEDFYAGHGELKFSNSLCQEKIFLVYPKSRKLF